VKYRKYLFLEAAGADGAAAGGGGAAAGTDAGAAGATGTGAAADAGAGGDKAAAGADAGAAGKDGAAATGDGAAAGADAGKDGADAAGKKSALAAGAAADEWSAAKVPEKFQVKNDKGELDINATFRKVEEHRANLEKRLGAGDNIRPKTPDDYKLPESETIKAIGLDEEAAKGFKAEAHEWGLTQTQYEKVMEKYATLAPQLVNAGQALSAEETITNLKGLWKDDYQTNITGAYAVAAKLAKVAGVSEAEMDAAIGNNPVGIRMLAAIAGEMREDKSSVSANGGTDAAAGGINALLAHPAYHDAKHPEHAAISKKVHDYYERTVSKDD
jgi:hypothetical protein